MRKMGRKIVRAVYAPHPDGSSKKQWPAHSMNTPAIAADRAFPPGIEKKCSEIKCDYSIMPRMVKYSSAPKKAPAGTVTTQAVAIVRA